MSIKELVEQKADLIAIKKGATKYVDGGLNSVSKSIKSLSNKSVFKDGDNSLERTIVGNTYYWMDSHDDVHGKGCFSKSIKENKAFHLHDHEFKITAKVGEPIRTYEDSVSWKDLNIDKSGTTEALFMDTEIRKDYNAQIFNEYKSNRINQHSVGMQYVKIDLAVNDEQYEEEYKVWTDNIDKLGNPQRANEKGFFWLVREAKLIEISAVLLGSNELTPTMGENKQADLESLAKTEADNKSLQLTQLLTNIKI